MKPIDILRTYVSEHGTGSVSWQMAEAAIAVIERTRLVDDGESEQCQRCLNLVDLVWHAPDEIWKKVTGITDGSGVYCVHCFSEMAWKVDMSLYWECAEDRFPTLFISVDDEAPTGWVIGATPIGDDDWIIRIGRVRPPEEHGLTLIEVGEGWHVISHWMPIPTPPKESQ